MQMARPEEFPLLMAQMTYIYQVMGGNNQPTAFQWCGDLAKQGIVNIDNMSQGGPAFHARRCMFSDEVKQFFDQIDYCIAMHELCKGLRRFTQVCQHVGIIKALPYGSEEQLYLNRLKPF